jgi:hypothetical protein
MALMFFHRQHAMNFDNVVDHAPHSLDAVGCKFSKRLGDLDVPASDVNFHELPP